MPKTDEACYQCVVCRHTCRHTITWLVAQVLAMLPVATSMSLCRGLVGVDVTLMC